MKRYLAIDIGGTSTKYSLADSSGVFFDKNEISTGATSDEQVNILINLINSYKESNDIAGVAICIPGFVDLKGNVLRVNAIPGFVNYPLKERLESLTGISTEIENDANCVALAEKFKGNAINSNDFIAMTLGTGIGAGIFANGKLLRGSSFMSGEIGFMITRGISNNIPFNCRWESIASVSALRKRVAMRLGKPLKEISGEFVFDLAENGNIHAKNEVERFFENLSFGIFNLIFILNPEKILIGGGISARPDLIDRIYEKLENLWSLEMAFDNNNNIKNLVTLEPTKFNNESGKIGALYHYFTCKRQNNSSF
ncbi:ROK family protein [Borreliella bissettiae DN127]|uniref:ROK family protein n=1 Tax=Borrelia bissettiae (strain DSM 17990 / CIP 109136 / DN127) TaxID=521010 RepID=G0AMR7_BORBD|nr:ROK family protein [Borreliella bissettiae]AEL18993.1 ROK family protein [Borreliella bissettiae DN127]